MEINQQIESTSSYVDTESMSEILESIKLAESHDEVIDLINTSFPGWIIGWPKRYSKDYPHFQNNWEFVCKKSQSKTLSVIIVDQIIFNDPKYKVIQLFCELLTVFGHSVRRKEEFIGCKICGDAIPTQMVYNQLVERKIPVPTCWMVKCRTC
jgi:hypothetical protein